MKKEYILFKEAKSFAFIYLLIYMSVNVFIDIIKLGWV